MEASGLRLFSKPNVVQKVDSLNMPAPTITPSSLVLDKTKLALYLDIQIRYSPCVKLGVSPYSLYYRKGIILYE
jgi:hypothetical protein